MQVQLTPERIMQTGLAFWPSKTLLSAIELGVFTELAKGPEAFAALGGRLGLHPRSALDFLDTLVALGFLTREGDRYANSPEADLFLDRKKPSYVGGILEMGHILHDWDLPTKQMLIAKAFEALPAGGALVVYEAITDDDRSRNAFGLMMSLNMLIDAGRLRLHRRRLHRLDEGCRLLLDPRRAARRARFEGHRHQVGTIPGPPASAGRRSALR
jgi:hypothetical protein